MREVGWGGSGQQLPGHEENGEVSTEAAMNEEE